MSNGAELGFGGLGFTDGGQQHSIFHICAGMVLLTTMGQKQLVLTR
jgi:hypothetical protein